MSTQRKTHSKSKPPKIPPIESDTETDVETEIESELVNTDSASETDITENNSKKETEGSDKGKNAKRTRSQTSSVSDTDKTPIKSQQKKQRVKTTSKSNAPKEGMEEIRDELRKINNKLSNVLEKNDPSLKDLIKCIVIEMKDDILKSTMNRIEILEGELFEKDKQNDALMAKIGNLTKEVEQQKHKNQKLKFEVDRNDQNAKFYSNDNEQYSRKANITITGLTGKENETADDTRELVTKTLNDRMKSLNLKDSEIDACHRVGNRRDLKRQIIVKFVSRRTKERIMKSKKDLRNAENRNKEVIFINDDLTSLTNHLLMCVKKKNVNEVESAWTRDGSILYKDKKGWVHRLRRNDYQTWLDLPWP